MRTIGVVAILALAPFTDAVAQEQPLQPGQRVRVTVPRLDLDKHKATFQRVTGDTLVLSSASYALADVTRLDVYAGERGHVGVGIGLGILVVGAAGTAVGVALAQDCQDKGLAACHGYVFIGAGGGMAVGALAGGIIGGMLKSDKWEEVSLDRLQVSVVPQRGGGIGFGMSIAF